MNSLQVVLVVVSLKFVHLKSCEVKNFKVQSIEGNSKKEYIFEINPARVKTNSTVKLAGQNIPKLCSDLLEFDGRLEKLTIDKCSVEEITKNFLTQKEISELEITNNNIPTILSQTFVNILVEKINLGFNKIQNIEKEAFVNLSELRTLVLENNELKKIQSESFVDLPRLNTFSVTKNQIEAVTKNNFNFITTESRKMINLENNKLRELDNLPFAGLKSLSIVMLGDNQITHLHENVFQGNSIEIILLQNNKLTTIPSSVYKQEELIELDVDGNPLTEGVVNEMKEWAKTSKQTFVFDPPDFS